MRSTSSAAASPRGTSSPAGYQASTTAAISAITPATPDAVRGRDGPDACCDADVPGDFVLSLACTDPQGATSALSTVTATVEAPPPNAAPTVDAGPDSALEIGQTVEGAADRAEARVHDAVVIRLDDQVNVAAVLLDDFIRVGADPRHRDLADGGVLAGEEDVGAGAAALAVVALGTTLALGSYQRRPRVTPCADRYATSVAALSS